MKTFCFLSLVLFALAISVVPTKSSDSTADVTAYAYSSEWTEYIFDPEWPGDYYTKTYQEAVGGVYASASIYGSYHANANVSGTKSGKYRIPSTFYSAGVDTAATVTVLYLDKTSSECGGTGSANSYISGASEIGTHADDATCFDYF